MLDRPDPSTFFDVAAEWPPTTPGPVLEPGEGYTSTPPATSTSGRELATNLPHLPASFNWTTLRPSQALNQTKTDPTGEHHPR